MLAVPPARIDHDGDRAENVVEEFSAVASGSDDFSDSFSGDDLLQDIDFEELFVEFDVLPDLEVDPNENLAEFYEDSGAAEVKSGDIHMMDGAAGKREDEGVTPSAAEPSAAAEDGCKSPMSAAPPPTKGSQGKRKVKVDWTPELHRLFVQAVEQLGVDKAVPSRILEIMGIDCLTRHNIASHLQKYRSHRKHLLAREAEAANWSQRRRQMSTGFVGHNSEMTSPSWPAPAMGFPPPPPPPPPPAPVQSFRPLHVWGHPTIDHAMMHMWPKHLIPSSSPVPPPIPWAPPHLPSPPEPSSFRHHRSSSFYRGMPNSLTQGTPCFAPQPLPPQARFPAPPGAGIPPQPMYKADNVLTLPGKRLQFQLHPSKETVDAALEDALSKPWLPLPLGLKPPPVESVLGELQKQGVLSIPPSCA